MGGLSFELENVHPQSKYITAVRSLTWHGGPMDSKSLIFRNRTVGEGSEQVARQLRPLSGFYVRRHQRVELELPSFRPAPGHHSMALELELAGVMVVRAAGFLQVVPA